MNFRTKIQIPEAGFKINHKHTLMFLGSCFSDNIGEQCLERKFNAFSNPFGVLYNPVVIADHIRRILHNDIVPELHKSGELWFDYRFHGSFSHPDKTMAANSIIKVFDQAKKHFQKTDVLFITWGTSFVYRLNATGETVANCHKQPAREFTREKLTVNGIVMDYSSCLNAIIEENPNMRIVFTVSPVRHLKDGFVENQRSKAALLLAAEALENKFTQVSYFPSYEIMMDDLRDYRFYDRDLTHPSPEAVDYLWERFSETFFDDNTKKLNQELKKLHTACQHKMLFPKSREAKQFALAQLRVIENLEKQHPYLSLEAEKNYFSSKG